MNGAAVLCFVQCLKCRGRQSGHPSCCEDARRVSIYFATLDARSAAYSVYCFKGLAHPRLQLGIGLGTRRGQHLHRERGPASCSITVTCTCTTTERRRQQQLGIVDDQRHVRATVADVRSEQLGEEHAADTGPGDAAGRGVVVEGTSRAAIVIIEGRSGPRGSARRDRLVRVQHHEQQEEGQGQGVAADERHQDNHQPIVSCVACPSVIVYKIHSRRIWFAGSDPRFKAWLDMSQPRRRVSHSTQGVRAGEQDGCSLVCVWTCLSDLLSRTCDTTSRS